MGALILSPSVARSDPEQTMPARRSDRLAIGSHLMPRSDYPTTLIELLEDDFRLSPSYKRIRLNLWAPHPQVSSSSGTDSILAIFQARWPACRSSPSTRRSNCVVSVASRRKP